MENVGVSDPKRYFVSTGGWLFVWSLLATLSFFSPRYSL